MYIRWHLYPRVSENRKRRSHENQPHKAELTHEYLKRNTSDPDLQMFVITMALLKLLSFPKLTVSDAYS